MNHQFPDATKMVVALDDDGIKVRPGDTIQFSYGIPPVQVRAKIVQRGRSLIALVADASPSECNLRSLRRHVGCWYRVENSK